MTQYNQPLLHCLKVQKIKKSQIIFGWDAVSQRTTWRLNRICKQAKRKIFSLLVRESRRTEAVRNEQKCLLPFKFGFKNSPFYEQEARRLFFFYLHFVFCQLSIFCNKSEHKQTNKSKNWAQQTFFTMKNISLVTL